MASPQILVQLVHLQGPFKGKIHEFLEAPILIGRGASCGLRFPSDLKEVSRNHARIVRDGNRFKIIDQSVNGTFVNGMRITEHFLSVGDVIMFGDDGPKVSFLTKITNGQFEIDMPHSSPAVAPAPVPQSAEDLGSEDELTISQVTTTGPNWTATIREELSKLPLGQIAFNPPREMKVGKTERIEVAISQNREIDITKSLKGKGIPEIIIAKVGTFMKAKLSGSGFEINHLTEEAQIVSGDDPTLWSWDVLPLKSGNKTLHLQVSIRIKLPGSEERKDHPVIDKQVRVQVNAPYAVKNFVTNNWKWIITALIIPLVGWLIKSLLK